MFWNSVNCLNSKTVRLTFWKYVKIDKTFVQNFKFIFKSNILNMKYNIFLCILIKKGK